MKYELIHRHDLHEAARQAGFRDINDIELGVMETDGTFSFFRRDPGGGVDEGQSEEGDASSERGATKIK